MKSTTGPSTLATWPWYGIKHQTGATPITRVNRNGTWSYVYTPNIQWSVSPEKDAFGGYINIATPPLVKEISWNITLVTSVSPSSVLFILMFYLPVSDTVINCIDLAQYRMSHATNKTCQATKLPNWLRRNIKPLFGRRLFWLSRLHDLSLSILPTPLNLNRIVSSTNDSSLRRTPTLMCIFQQQTI